MQLAATDVTGWRSVGQGVWENDFPAESVQLATFTHAEMAADRFSRQLASALDGVANGADPHWTAVTTYYASFYAAQSLLLRCGSGAVRFTGVRGLPFQGVYAISAKASNVYAGRVAVRLSSVGGSSHRATWREIVDLLDDLVGIESNPRAILVLETLKKEISRPRWLSDARNEINYDLTSSPFRMPNWPSLLFKLDNESQVEDELARSEQVRTERRFEIVTMSLAILSAQLREEYRVRGGRIDSRQIREREAILPSHSWLVMHERA
ncbi:hypothetical protein [Micromonospora humida]|uniref:Uncharacterized protein n=1 Tax=Micromonospora humida TaxID=2809018 RepID=A0ABS2IVH4_9ACTN|nr:hypothetical protein [Micromonospora humida]MBM7078054.1 hypothetical protein [Micromonospora humida]